MGEVKVNTKEMSNGNHRLEMLGWNSNIVL